MGWTFSNVSILKDSIREAELRKLVVQHMKKQGLTPVKTAHDAEKSVRIVNNPASKWITIHEDDTDGSLQDQLAAALTKKFHTQVLSLMNMDSDFMQIDLYFGAKKDTVLVGTPYDMDDAASPIPRGDPMAWKAIAKDPEALVAQFAKEYTFSEEVIPALQAQIGICLDDLLNTPPADPGTSADLLLYFAAKDGSDPYITDGPTVLAVSSRYELKINTEAHASFINTGGSSTGLGIWILGPCVEKQAITVDEVSIRRYEDPRDADAGADSLRTMTAKTRITNTNYGENSIHAAFPDFVIPEGIKLRNLSDSRKYMKIYFQHIIDVTFLPRGPEDTDIADLYIIAHPLTNPAGCTMSQSWKEFAAGTEAYEKEHGYI